MYGIYSTAKDVYKTFSNVLETLKSADSITDIKIPEDKRTLLEARGSIMRILSPFIIEPSIVVSDSLKEQNDIQKIIDLNVDMFTAFYAQVFNVLVNVHGLDGKVVFDILSSKRVPGAEHRNHELDKILLGEVEYLPLEPKTTTPSLEASSNKKTKWDYLTSREKIAIIETQTKDTIKAIKKKEKNGDKLSPEEEALLQEASVKRGKRNIKTLDKALIRTIKAKQKLGEELTQAERLILQGKDVEEPDRKLPDRKNRAKVKEKGSFQAPSTIHKEVDLSYDVHTKSGSYTVEVPLVIKANIIYTSFNSILNVLDNDSDRVSFFSRLDEYRSGGITLSELIFAHDLIKEYKEHKLKDKNDILTDIENRATSANLKLFSKQAIGLDKFYGIVILARYEQDQIELMLRGKIEKAKYRDKFLTAMKSMILTSVDLDYEMLSIYVKDIRGSSTVPIKSLKKDKGNTDMTEMFKLLTMNRSPIASI